MAATPIQASALEARRSFHEFPGNIFVAHEAVHGQRAVDLLGANIGQVAGWYGKTVPEFRAMLLGDSSYKLDASGRLFVEESVPLGASNATATATAIASEVEEEGEGAHEALFADNLTFKLHSRPGAKRTIYLDFDGAEISNTVWGRHTVQAPAFNLDGSEGFSSSEMRVIQFIWQRVAEDFAPFEVDVTTQVPASPGLLTRSSQADDVFGITAVITSTVGVFSCQCAGYAYVGVFDDVGDYFKPALVFYDMLFAAGEKNVAEVISHEVGHTLGLFHDGGHEVEYYAGHGSGPTGWAPIMGEGYQQPLVQWSKGEYSGANNTQDDIAVMQSYGLPLREDDFGDTVASAWSFRDGVNHGDGFYTFHARGVVHASTDVDVFSFFTQKAVVTAAAMVAARSSSNLDVQLTLLDSAGQVVATANPVGCLSANMSFFPAKEGFYFLSVRGSGEGEVHGTGYSPYGSVGNYQLSVTAMSGWPPTPAARAITETVGHAPLAVTFTAVDSSDAFAPIVSYEWSFGDGHTDSSSGAIARHVYTSVGSFQAVVRVTNLVGLGSTSPAIVVTTTRLRFVHVDVLTLTLSRSRLGRVEAAVVVVQVVDADSRPVDGATVSSAWSGSGVLASHGSASQSTNGLGHATFVLSSLRSKGKVTFTVLNIVASNAMYNTRANTVPSSISRMWA